MCAFGIVSQLKRLRILVLALRYVWNYENRYLSLTRKKFHFEMTRDKITNVTDERNSRIEYSNVALVYEQELRFRCAKRKTIIFQYIFFFLNFDVMMILRLRLILT